MSVTFVQSLKNNWRELADSPPGKRFQKRYEKKQREGNSGRTWKLVAAVLLIVAGIVLLVISGAGVGADRVGCGVAGGEFVERRAGAGLDGDAGPAAVSSARMNREFPRRASRSRFRVARSDRSCLFGAEREAVSEGGDP